MKIIRFSILVMLVFATLNGLPQKTTAQSDKLDTLVLAGPPGPLSIPLVYLVANDKLSNVADDVELVLWEDQNQLRAIMAGEQADFVTMPSNNAAIFYNNDFDIQLLDISVWNSSFAVSADSSITSLADAEGLRVVIPFQGSVPDLMFQYLADANDLDPFEDFDVQYAMNPPQAAQLIMSGQADLAILPEPQVTAVLLQTKDSDAPLQRVFSLGTEWAAATDDEAKTAIAGTVALSDIQDHPDVIEAFSREYELAVEWTIAHPDEAGELAEEYLSELGFTARPVSLSLQNVVWEYVPAAEGQDDINEFFSILMELSPDVIGGQLPDDGFYYGAE
jgi:NitT/TauT family transport system substrate-binding protein